MTHVPRTFAVAVCAATALALSLSDPASAQGGPSSVITRSSVLQALKRDANSPALRAARAKLLRDAAEMAAEPMVAVTDKHTVMPPSGDKHDYLSLSPYWWPDSTKPGGLPYIRRDGVTNPESKADLDQPRLAKLGERVQTFTLAWWLTGDSKWATLAAQQVRTWFVDPATRMNPNLTFSQLVRGRDEERGTGIIDGRGFMDVVDMMGMLRQSKALSDADDAAVVAWFRQYNEWLATSSHGQKEHAAKNNHGGWYAAQASAVALFVGDTARVRTLANETRARIGWQIKPDGMQPEEMVRTRSMHYTTFSAEALSRVAEIAQQVGVDLWHFTAPEGGSLAKTIGLLAQYAGRETTWPGQQIDAMSRTDLLRTLARARLALGDAVYDDAIGRLPADQVEKDRSTLLFWRGR
jgi:hypothetical protein